MFRRRQRHARRINRNKPSSQPRKSSVIGRSLHHERLEDRHLLALLGVVPTLPIIGYDSGGSVNYNSTTDTYSIAASPLTINIPSNPQGFFFTGSVNLNIKVDNTGSLISGVAGDDLTVTGDVDVDGDFVPDYLAINGALLTGEISQFGFKDSGGSTDSYDFRFTITGGQLAGYFAGKELGIVTTSELSTFVNDFNIDFHGGAKGQIGAIDKQAAHLSGHKYTDLTGDGFSADDTPLSGVLINLYQDFGVVGVLDGPDVLFANDTTDINGKYSFDNLPPGNYLVQEMVPVGYQPTSPTTLAVTLAAGDNITTGFDVTNFQYGRITGTKFTDITGDSFSADDTGLGGVTINLYQGTSTSGTLVASTTTAADGTYSFDNLALGTYFVQETRPSGYVQTGGNAGYVVTIGGSGISSGGTSSGNDFDNFQKGRITGTKFTDITGDSFSADDTGLGGVTINLYQGTSTSGTLLSSTTTASNGTYSFNDLAPGTYFVQETLPSGYVQTGGNAGYVVVIGAAGVTSGGTSTGNDFDNFKKAKITGKKYKDLTGNSFSSDDTGLGGVTINLYQGNSTSGALVASTNTASDGSYSFTNLGPGTYFVQEVVQAGWTQTGGNDGYAIIIGAGGVVSGGSSTGNNFDNFQNGKITGKKYKDLTGNSFSSDDTGLGGVTIKLYQGTSTSGTLVASTTTASDGSYSFTNLGPGTYFVQEVVQAGWTQTGGNAGYVVIVGAGGIGCGGTASGKDFDNFQNGKITGKKYKDLTGNSFSSDDTGLGGVTIKLYQGTSTSGALVASTTTASDGSYSFTNLGPGTYFVQEVVQAGWTQTGGNAGYVVIVGAGGIGCGGTASGKDFDNFQNGTISGSKYLDRTGNGVSADDTGYGGVTINLYRDMNNDGQLTSADGSPVATTVTAAGTGAYSFGNVAPGTYFVKEVVGSGFLPTAPTSGMYKVVVSSCGSTTTGLNFANFDTSDCARIGSEITCISYLINNSTTVTDLRGNTNQGDVVQVTFTVAAGTPPHQLTLVSYTAPGASFDANVASQQQVYDYDTGVFGPGTYTLEVRNANSFYQVDFICGAFIDRFGPAGSNIFYSAQGRLISADNDGTVAVLANGSSLAGKVFVDGNKNNARDLGEVGIGGVKITLTGTDSQGAAVNIVEYTKSDGTYLFGNLKAGTYKIAEAQPSGFSDGQDILGSLAGTLGNDCFSSITVGASAKGINYDFGEKLTNLGSGYSAGFQVDPTDSTKAAIVVNGTSGTDVITVTYSSSKYNIVLNGTTIASLANKDSSSRSVARLIVNGGAGNDDISIDSSVTITTELYGGEGHDRLIGGGGYNILVGANGTDTIVGGPLANLIIAGNGSDTVIGGSSADLIVAGSTAYDSNATALRAIFAEWSSSRDYTTRINNILGVGSGTRSNGNYFLSADKVFDDGEIDQISANGGRDWLFAQLGLNATDVLTGLASDETVTGIQV